MVNRPGNDDRIIDAGANGASRGLPNDSARQGAPQNGGTQVRSRSNRGFASMDRDKQKEIASKGGKAAHAKGTAHEFDSGEAREAGRKGGMAVSRNRDHMAAIGRRGGEARGQSRGRGADDSRVDANIQPSRGANSDRQVAIDNQNDGVTANPQGNRGGGNNSLGGERGRQNSLNSESANRGESFGNR